MKSIQFFICFVMLAGALLMGACTKPGLGGKAEIHFEVKHHDRLIPHAKVYIKYGEKDFPGTNTAVYDDSTLTDAKAHGHFHDLKKGSYYLYSVGYDSAGPYVVTGGVHVKLKKSKGEVDVEIPVSE